MAPGLGRYAYVEDPWGSKIQLVEDPETPGFHHVHLRVPDPARTRAWYLERFGGAPARHKGTLDGLQYGRVWLFLEAGAAPPSRGRAIDHFGWRMPDLLAKAAELKTKGVTFTVEPKPGPASPGAPQWMSFTEDPWGVKIELLQRGA
ncbi:MAG: VOC family protein [Acidobacteria bacterium]|nr:VOC family protein [Acidobacteriota bacterium]